MDRENPLDLLQAALSKLAAETARADRAEELTRGYYNEAATALEQRDEANRRADREAAALAVARSTLEESLALIIEQRDREAAARQEAERALTELGGHYSRCVAERHRLRAELVALRGKDATL